MAKDPAFLFYPGDWQGGTQTLSRFIKGCYLDILVAQFNNGPLSLEEIKTVLGSDFGTSWPTLQKKFKKSAEGLFFNERLASEQKKRTEHSEQQRKRIQDYWNRKKNVLEDSTVYTGIDTKKVPLENRNENENRNEVRIGGVGESKTELIEIFFNDLPNCSYIETISRNTKLTKDQVLGYIPSFRLKADVTYPSFDRFVNHFKNFINLEKNGKQKFTSDRQERLSSLDNLENLAESLLRGDQSGVGG